MVLNVEALRNKLDELGDLGAGLRGDFNEMVELVLLGEVIAIFIGDLPFVLPHIYLIGHQYDYCLLQVLLDVINPDGFQVP